MSLALAWWMRVPMNLGLAILVTRVGGPGGFPSPRSVVLLLTCAWSIVRRAAMVNLLMHDATPRRDTAIGEFADPPGCWEKKWGAIASRPSGWIHPRGCTCRASALAADMTYCRTASGGAWATQFEGGLSHRCSRLGPNSQSTLVPINGLHQFEGKLCCLGSGTIVARLR
jgi:hypothetical protein